MPVYIKELVVRARVESSQTTASPPDDIPAREPVDRATIVEDCVEEVLRILEREKER